MPFNKLAQFKKVNSLDAEIKGAAFCGTEGLVAFVSSSPVRLGTNATNGGNGKITNASFDTAEDVAILSRHAALVRTAEHTVWSLLDLTNKAKIDEVARDVKLLRGRPSGGEAFALLWDGSGLHITAAKTEIETRGFPLRGDVRAVDVTDTECWVVVDGEGGGQLRVHPGATPEPGPVLRCDLPEEAKKFDRLRAGPRLAVLYKAGQSVACLGVGAPNKLKAKMIRLEGKPADLAVLETSLFAVYEDGRCALYDSEAINNSVDGSLEAKHSVPIGGATPRVALTITRGNAAIWVGTARGEVMMAAIGRKT